MVRQFSTTEEQDRLTALGEYDFSAPGMIDHLDRIVMVAASLLNVPIALITTIGKGYQFFSGKTGIKACGTDRSVSFCTHAIQDDADIFFIPDATRDDRFRQNPLVTGEPHIRFYAGVPLRTPSGHAIGALCVIDQRPKHHLSDGERSSLHALAALALDRLEVQRLTALQTASQLRFSHIAATSPDGIICTDAQGTITFWNKAAQIIFEFGAEEAVGRNIAATSPDGIICTDAQGTITFWNKAAQHIFAFASQEALGQNIAVMIPEAINPNFRDMMKTLSDTGMASCVGRTAVLSAARKGGAVFVIELSLSMWTENGMLCFGSIIRDITERRANETRLFKLAHFEPLTSLPNRAAFYNRLRNALYLKQQFAIVVIDLDGFKDVNDTLGHSAGDSLLKLAAQRLVACVDPAATVARLGGDEFAVLLPDLADPIVASTMADSLLAALAGPFEIDASQITIGASAGIALFPSHGDNAEDLMVCADLALYQAKGAGKNCRRLFVPGLRQAVLRKRAYEGELRQAEENHEFELFYQPQVRLSDRAVVGLECLIRWRHPRHGLLHPQAFLPALETGLLAAQVGDWALETACLQAATWRNTSGVDLRIGVNLFAAQLRTGDLADKVGRALQRSGLPASALELEITETTVIRRDDSMLAPLRALRAQGVGIAFDDYGTGYASLSLLKSYPLSRLKIDQGFVRNICTSSEDAAVVRLIIELGRSFRLDIIAEGVETRQQVDLLTTYGCQEVQGYFFGHPMSNFDFTRFLEQYRTVRGVQVSERSM